MDVFSADGHMQNHGYIFFLILGRLNNICLPTRPNFMCLEN
jgi:hypothetical protein